MRRRRSAAAATLVLAALLLPAAPAALARGTDPALRALRDHDVFVDRVGLGPRADWAQRTLEREAARLRSAGRPVKLAIVRGPHGARSVAIYARLLALRTGFRRGTIVVTTARRGHTAAVGPRATSEMTRLLRAARVGAVRDPVARVIRAARVAAPFPTPPSRWRQTLALLGVAAIGGAWAAATGLGRRERERRRALAETRAGLRLLLDAMRARALAVVRAPGGPAPAQREHVERALGLYAESVSALQESRTVDDLGSLLPRVRDGLREVAEAAGVPSDAPFAGLCAADPAHGLAVASGPLEDMSAVPLCAACCDAALAGRPAARRRLPVEGRPVPFDDPRALEGIVGATPRATPS